MGGFKLLVASLVVTILAATPVPAQTSQTQTSQTQASQTQAPRSGAAASLSDDQIRDIIVQRSIAAYSGRCPCPENRMSNGARCGHRSAYERPNGEAPKCYRRDVSAEEVARFRSANRN